MNTSPKANILLVDDRPDQLLVLEAALEGLEQNIVTALSGEQALRELESQEFAAILLDIRMPGMDGFETARLIRQRNHGRDTPIIFITASGQAELDLPRCYALGAIDYIQIPVVPQILRSKVGALAELYIKRQQVEHQADELRKRVQELSETNRELAAFSYSLSHDLRAPLRAIHRFTDLVLETHRGSLSPEASDFLERSVSAAERMDRLVQSLLALNLASRREVRMELIDVERLLREIISERPEWQPPLANIQIDGCVPPIRGDEVSVTQCLANLVGNAVKFVAPGIVPEIRIYCQAQDGKARVWIEDNGIGIPKEAHTRIFEAFQRMPQAQHYEGEGIGLAIVHRAVERMGGQVGVESEINKGSRFWIELPTLTETLTKAA